jgi:hypothetical protein
VHCHKVTTDNTTLSVCTTAKHAGCHRVLVASQQGAVVDFIFVKPIEMVPRKWAMVFLVSHAIFWLRLAMSFASSVAARPSSASRFEPATKLVVDCG